MLFDESMDKVKPPFCKTCGTLAAKGCPKGHDSTLNDKIKNNIQAEDGTRVLVSDYDLGKEFWPFLCENHRYPIYVLKIIDSKLTDGTIRYKEPPPFLRIPNSVNPCSKWHGNDSETYKRKVNLIPQFPRIKTDAETKLDNWVSNPNKRQA